jgi:hypothetical protein
LLGLHSWFERWGVYLAGAEKRSKLVERRGGRLGIVRSGAGAWERERSFGTRRLLVTLVAQGLSDLLWRAA